jgi:hypothetical protein
MRVSLILGLNNPKNYLGLGPGGEVSGKRTAGGLLVGGGAPEHATPRFSRGEVHPLRRRLDAVYLISGIAEKGVDFFFQDSDAGHDAYGQKCDQ